MKYSDMWTFKDTDGKWCIAVVRSGAGHTEIKPYYFNTEEAAQDYINAVMGR